MYPDGPDAAQTQALAFTLPAVANSPNLEDASRPHFFGGVCLVVARLFDLMRPSEAIFGEKDWQQLKTIQAMVAETSRFNDITITPSPTIRETDGLAMSSRNQGLTPSGLKTAASLSRALFAAQSAFEAGEHDGAALIRCSTQELADPQLRLEYLELVDPHSLEPVEKVDASQGARMLIAAQVEKVRLIDNVAIGGTAT